MSDNQEKRSRLREKEKGNFVSFTLFTFTYIVVGHGACDKTFNFKADFNMRA